MNIRRHMIEKIASGDNLKRFSRRWRKVYTFLYCKKIVSVLFSVFIIQMVPAYAEVLKADSKITSVTVYPDSAMVTRSTILQIQPGEYSISFDDVVPEVDENTLSVSGSGTSIVKLFGAHTKREYLNQSPDVRISELTQKIEDISDQITEKNSEIQILNEQKDFLNSIKLFSGKQLPKDLVTQIPTTDQLEGIMNFLVIQNTSVETKKEEIRRMIRDLQKNKEALLKEMADLNVPKEKIHRSIIVDLQCEKAGKFTLNISYLVYGVSWLPVYDARASIDNGSVELTTFGLIQQRTGEDWEDVEFIFSTARPAVGGRLPYIAPWFIRPFQGYPVAAGRLTMKAAARDAQFEAFNIQALNNPAEDKPLTREAPASIAYSQIESKGISVVYKIPRKVSVNSDGSQQRIPIASQILKSDFEYATYPRLSSFAYLGSRVKNGKDSQLLAGKVNVFLEGNFVGASSIDYIGPGEEFDLYLGVDENVKIKRDQIEKKVDDVILGGIPSPNRKTTFKYKLTAENYKDRKIKLSFYEALPVSENDRIKVKVIDVTLPPKDRDWKDRKGIWRWELFLDPNAKQEVSYSFIVEHPKDIQLEGL